MYEYANTHGSKRTSDIFLNYGLLTVQCVGIQSSLPKKNLYERNKNNRIKLFIK